MNQTTGLSTYPFEFIGACADKEKWQWKTIDLIKTYHGFSYKCPHCEVERLMGIIADAVEAVECSDDFMAGIKHKQEFLQREDVNEITKGRGYSE